MKMSFYKMFNILNIEIYTFIGGIGVKGSFEGLYTFLEVAEIYGIDDSCLRKQVARGKFVIGEEVKKMGRTWIITEQAMIKSFGALKFEEYKKKQQKKEQAKENNMEKVDEIIELKKNVASMKAEMEEKDDRYKRIMAEFENYKKRSAKERETLYESIISEIVSSFLPVLDNLEKAVAAETKDEEYKKGVELMYQQFKDVLGSKGVKEIETVGNI